MTVDDDILRAQLARTLSATQLDALISMGMPALLDLPKGISRHEVRFLAYPNGIYVVKELQRRPARNDFTVLRALEAAGERGEAVKVWDRIVRHAALVTQVERERQQHE